MTFTYQMHGEYLVIPRINREGKSTLFQQAICVGARTSKLWVRKMTNNSTPGSQQGDPQSSWLVCMPGILFCILIHLHTAIHPLFVRYSSWKEFTGLFLCLESGHHSISFFLVVLGYSQRSQGPGISCATAMPHVAKFSLSIIEVNEESYVC